MCSNTVLQYKKSISLFYMPNKGPAWCDGRGNPTKCSELNDMIAEMKVFECKRDGCPPSCTKHPLRCPEFIKTLELLRAQAGFDCKVKFPTMCVWQ